MARRHRRSAGEGTLFFWEEKGLWVGRITLPDGKKRTKTSKKQQAVKDWLLAERNKVKQGIFVSDDKLTLGSFLNRYLEEHAKKSLRTSTLESYRFVIEKHIIPELGAVRLVALTPIQINHLISKVASRRTERFAEYVLAILKASLNVALKWELIGKNPALLVTPPKVEFRVPTTWSAGELQTFLSHIKDDRWAGIYYLACTGMRKGEILGLPLSALHLDKGYLMVVQTLYFIQGKGIVLQQPKTKKSRRLIVLPDFVREALDIHLAKRQVLAQSPKWKESGLVFTTDIGTAINPHNMLKHFKANLTAVGLPNIKFHSLRHSVASILLERNVHVKLVSELLGHSNTSLTLNTYSHVINPLNTIASDTMNDALGGLS
jgi:integrase